MPIHQIIMNPFCFTEIFLPSFTDNIFRGGTAYPSRTHGFTPLQCLMESVLLIFLFVLDLLTNVICVSWFHPLPSFRWDSGFDHQCCLYPLGSPPVLFVTCFFVVHFVSIFQHENHVWFIFVLSCWSDGIYLFLMVCVYLRIMVSNAPWLYLSCVLFVLCVVCLVLPVSLDCPFLIDASVLSTLFIYLTLSFR